MEGADAPSSLIAAGTKRIASLSDRIRPPKPGIVVLIYHRISGRSRSRVDLPEWLFEEQMARIRDTPGTVDLDTALQQLESNRAVPAAPVVLTFDDGTADFVEIALPVLVRYRLPATLYVATDFIERGRHFPGSGPPVSWAALADAVTTGLVTIGSHTHQHSLLDRIGSEAAAEDLDRSIDLIGSRLGVEARHFAYPKAVLGTPAVQAEIRIRFRSAAIAGTKPNPYGATDPYRLARSPVQVGDGLHFFEAKVAGGMRLEDDVRRLVNRRRLAGQTS